MRRMSKQSDLPQKFYIVLCVTGVFSRALVYFFLLYLESAFENKKKQCNSEFLSVRGIYLNEKL